MNRKRVVTVAVVAVCIAAAFAVWNVNVKYGVPKKEIYPMEAAVRANGYEYQVRECRLLEPEDFPEGIEKTDELKAVLVVKIYLRSLEGNKSVSGANLMVQGGMWGNSMDLELFYVFNEEVISGGWNKKIDENGIELWIPFRMYAVQVADFSLEEMKSEQYELVISLTPFRSIMLDMEND